MKIEWAAPGLDQSELEEYLSDAFRGPSFALAEPMWVRRPAWRGTALAEQKPPLVRSWATKRAVAATFGPLLQRRDLHAVLAVVHHDDGDEGPWAELVTRG